MQTLVKSRHIGRAVLASLCLVLAIAGFATATQSASVELAHPPVIGFGMQPCNRWPTSLTEHTYAGNPYAQWILGIASGKNLFAPPKQGAIFLAYDEYNIVNYISRYCSSHPDRLISEAAVAFLYR